LRWGIKRFLSVKGLIKVKVVPFDFLHPYVPMFLIGPIQRLGKILEKTPLIKEISGSLIIYAEKK